MYFENFDAAGGTLRLAKALQEQGRFDFVQKHFANLLCTDNYFENMHEVTSSLFSRHFNSYDEYESTEIMGFEDDVLSNYYVHAADYGKLHRLRHDKNPYVTWAQEEVGAWLPYSYCTGWRLLGYTKSRKAARKSKLIVYRDTGCPCNAYEQVAYGLIKIRDWFAKESAKLEARLKQAAPARVAA